MKGLKMQAEQEWRFRATHVSGFTYFVLETKREGKLVEVSVLRF